MVDGGTYGLSFQAAQRAIYQPHYEEIEVLVDGAEIGTIDPSGTAYAAYRRRHSTWPPARIRSNF